MKFKSLLLTFLMFGIYSLTFAQTNPNFYLHANGVTCMCPNAAIGETGIVNGVTYTKRTREQITPENASTTCTSGITDMNQLFYSKRDFNGDISSWDVSNVTNMFYMFYGTTTFNQPIGTWNVSSVTNMGGIFFGAKSFNQPIGDWDVTSVINMSEMFTGASTFNQNIDNWDISNVKDISFMFSGAATFNQPIGTWNVSNVTNMSFMFNLASTFNQPIGTWNVSSVTNMAGMFRNTTVFNQAISNWNVSSVTDMESMFSGATVFNLPINNWCVIKITSEPINFSTSSALTTQNKPIWGTCSTLSNDEFEWLSSNVSIYPNPFVNETKVYVPENVQVKQVQVINNIGQTVYSANTIELKLEHLQTGLYYLKITTDKGIVNEKIIKN